MTGSGGPATGSEDYDSGRYAPDQKARTYEALLDASLRDIREGRNAIVDATFSRAAYREPSLRAAEEHGIPLLLVHVSATEAVTRDGDLRTLPCFLAEDGGMDGFFACRLRKPA